MIAAGVITMVCRKHWSWPTL